MVLTIPPNLRLGVGLLLLRLRPLLLLLFLLLLLLDTLRLRTTLHRRAVITILLGILLLRDTLRISILQDTLHLLQDMAILRQHMLLPRLPLVTLSSLDLNVKHPLPRLRLPPLLLLRLLLFSSLLNPGNRLSTSNMVTDRMATISIEVIKTISLPSLLRLLNQPKQTFRGLITMAQCLL